VAREGCALVRAHLVGTASRVVDLAVGEGVWLEAARELLGAEAELIGVEIDPVVAARCQAALRACGGPSRVIVGDGSGVALEGGCDVVVGNPPFRSPRLRSARFDALAPVDWPALRRRYPGANATTDLSAYFFARGFSLLREGGVLAMVMPASFLSAGGAAWVRALVEQGGRLCGLAPLPRGTFAASVWSVLVVVRREAHGQPAAWTEGMSDAPEVALAEAGTLEEVAWVAAGFREEYYALTKLVRSGREVEGLPVVTVGSITRDGWRPRTARIGGRRIEEPVVPIEALDALPRSLARLLVPKVLVAPQKPLILPVRDEEGILVPMTPIVSVVAREGVSEAALAALLAAPVASARIDRSRAGAALSPGHLLVSAAALRRLPLPADRDTWAEAAAALEEGAPVSEVARRMLGAYEIADEPAGRLMAWWKSRFALAR
jgi:hypothetical protein